MKAASRWLSGQVVPWPTPKVGGGAMHANTRAGLMPFTAVCAHPWELLLISREARVRLALTERDCCVLGWSSEAYLPLYLEPADAEADCVYGRWTHTAYAWDPVAPLVQPLSSQWAAWPLNLCAHVPGADVFVTGEGHGTPT